MKKIYIIIRSFGFEPIKTIRSALGLLWFLRDLINFIFIRKSNRTKNFKIKIFPILDDKFASSGVASGHYFHQDLLVARMIFERRPEEHVDVGSRIDGFIAHLLVFMPVNVIDIRPLNSKVRGLTFLKRNITSPEFASQKVFRSVSCLHALEHFGLGRYGDPVDPNAWEQGIKNLAKMVSVGGRLYFSVPIGTERVEFNAHRVFNPITIVKAFSENGLDLCSFSYVDDSGDLYERVEVTSAQNMEYGCGIFEFSKK